MPISRVTSKGQVTIPSEVRKALEIEQGDDLLFELTADKTAQLRVIKRQRLSDFYGALRAQRPFPGKDAVRDEVGKALSPERSSSRVERRADSRSLPLRHDSCISRKLQSGSGVETRKATRSGAGSSPAWRLRISDRPTETRLGYTSSFRSREARERIDIYCCV